MQIFKIVLSSFILIIGCRPRPSFTTYNNHTIWQDTIEIESDGPYNLNHVVVKLNFIPDTIYWSILKGIICVIRQPNDKGLQSFWLSSRSRAGDKYDIKSNSSERYLGPLVPPLRCFEPIYYTNERFATLCGRMDADPPSYYSLRGILLDSINSFHFLVRAVYNDSLNMELKSDLINDVFSDLEIIKNIKIPINYSKYPLQKFN